MNKLISKGYCLLEKNDLNISNKYEIILLINSRIALLLLSDWVKLNIKNYDLYQEFEQLKKPNWGTWNQIISKILKSVKKELAANNTLLSESQIKSYRVLDFIYSEFKNKYTIEEVSFDGQSKISLLDMFQEAVSIRNAHVHKRYTEDQLQESDKKLNKILMFFYESDILSKLDEISDYDSVWFKKYEDDVYSFNGLQEKDSVIVYIHPFEVPKHEKLTDEFSNSYAKLFGVESYEDISTHNSKFSENIDDIKGVYIKNYLVGEPIGYGGFAKIHKAVNMNTGAKVAMKILNDGADKTTIERFQNEAEILKVLQHDNIVKILDRGETFWTKGKDSIEDEWYQDFKKTQTKNYIVMEWINGSTFESVFDILKENKDYSIEKFVKEGIKDCDRSDNNINFLLEIFKKSASALDYIHKENHIHRDIKPSNIMVNRYGEVKIMDFGIAKNFIDSESLTRTGQTLGTRLYMSPEQLKLEKANIELGPTTDIYSLCATFYEMFTGTYFYDTDKTESSIITANTKKLNGELPEQPRKRSKYLSRQLNDILMGGLQTEPSRRYKSMNDLAVDIENCRNNKPINYKKPNIFLRMYLVYKRNKALSIIAVMFIFFLVIVPSIFGFYIWRENNLKINASRLLSDAKTAYENNNYKKAKKLADQVIDLYDDLFEAYVLKGDIAINENEYKKSIKYYSIARSINDNPNFLADNIFSAYVAIEHQNTILELQNDLTEKKLKSEFYNKFVLMDRHAFDQNDSLFIEDLDYLIKGVEDNKTKARLFNHASMIYLKYLTLSFDWNTIEIIDILHYNSLSFDSTNYITYSLMARSSLFKLINSSKENMECFSKELLENLEKSISLNKNQISPYLLLYKYFASNDKSKSANYLKECLTYNPDLIELYSILTTMYLELEEHDKLVYWCYEGLRHNPNDQFLYYNLANGGFTKDPVTGEETIRGWTMIKNLYLAAKNGSWDSLLVFSGFIISSFILFIIAGSILFIIISLLISKYYFKWSLIKFLKVISLTMYSIIGVLIFLLNSWSVITQYGFIKLLYIGWVQGLLRGVFWPIYILKEIIKYYLTVNN
jgi:serine/threonine protein kinase